jgi:hypothetical protein
VQVHPLDRHLVDRRFGLGEPFEQLPGADASGKRERRVLDQPEDLGEAAV